MATLTDDTTKVLRQVWLTAANRPEGFVLDCGDKSTALYYRMRMYRAAKRARERPETDPELAEALSFLSIATPTDGKLHVVPVTMKGALASIAAQIGFNPREEAARQQSEAEAELTKRVSDELARKMTPGGAAAQNPYDTRE